MEVRLLNGAIQQSEAVWIEDLRNRIHPGKLIEVYEIIYLKGCLLDNPTSVTTSEAEVEILYQAQVLINRHLEELKGPTYTTLMKNIQQNKGFTRP